MTYNDVEWSEQGKDGRKKSDVAIMGVPFDMASTNHAGQRSAPYTIRNAGFWEDLTPLRGDQVNPLDVLAVVDVGDVDITPADPVGSWKEMEERAFTVYGNTRRLITMGGDHSITAKVAAGVARSEKCPLTIVHFDAHTDYFKHDPGAEMNHASWVRWAIENGVASRVIQFGVRGWGVSKSDRLWAEKNDIVTYYAQDSSWFQSLCEELRDNSDPIYLSIDLDVLDPAFAPGVAYQEPGGITTRELFRAVSVVASDPALVAADVVELIPDRDPDGITAKVANRLVTLLVTTTASTVNE